MKKKLIILLTICAFGGALIGFNTGKLNNGLNIVLFVFGLAMVGISLAMLGQTWRRK